MAKLLLAEVLRKHKLTKYRFAKRLGVRYNYVFRYFNKGYDPKLSTLEKWARAIGCKIRDLYEE